ncbi:nucleotidyltransferase family protein [Aquimarina longa]|uniref:nucleotidyltransferase family protein n=1 Tax=Aquimarina longa TaxID=1080221 RepID=UPI000783BD68|nr:nucleotidyltransferase family protein [Aquimarina longa]
MPPKKPKIAHLILAAGSSTRMREPKQLLPWGDTTMIGYAIEQALLIKDTSVYVVLGAYYDAIYKEVNHFPITIFKNIDWQSGMGSTIRCGIQGILKDDLQYDVVLISLVDQPLLGAVHYASMITQFCNHSNTIIVATALGERVGVPAMIPITYFDELTELKADYGARYIIKENSTIVKTISVADKGLDIDTIEEYHSVLNTNFSS